MSQIEQMSDSADMSDHSMSSVFEYNDDHNHVGEWVSSAIEVIMEAKMNISNQ